MRFTLVLTTILLLQGCGMTRLGRAKAPPPPGPIPARIPDQVTSIDAPPPTNLPPPPSLPAPAVDAKPSTAAELAISSTPTLPPPRPARSRKTTKRAAVIPPPQPPVEAAAEVPVQPAAPPFRLGELRSPEEKERLKQQTEQMIGVCGAALTAAEGKPLTAAQTEMVARVRMFAEQAREAMEKDPAEARNFAAKGRTFAEVLLAELK